MSPHPALMKYDILLEIVRCFSLMEPPYDSHARRDNRYWGPPQPEQDENKKDNDSFLGADGTDWVKRRTLARLALTCKAFSEPALDELWAIPRGGLYSLLHLFSVFTHKTFTGYTKPRIKPYTVREFVSYIIALVEDPL